MNDTMISQLASTSSADARADQIFTAEPAVTALLVVIGFGTTTDDIPADASAVYKIMGSGPDGSTFELQAFRPKVRITGIKPGVWNVNVSVENPEGGLVGRGGATVSVVENTTNRTSVCISPTANGGFFDITVRWHFRNLERPTVLGRISAPGGSESCLRFEPEAERITRAGGLIDAGVYIARIQLLDQGKLVGGGAEPICLETGRMSTMRYELGGERVHCAIPPAGASKGSPVQTMATRMVNTGSTFTTGGEMTMLAEADGSEEGTQYLWYLNGRPLCSSSRCTIGTCGPPGPQRLDLIAYSRATDRIGSATHYFEIPRF